MDSTTSNENEREKTAAACRRRKSLNRYTTYGLYLALLLIVIKYIFKQYPIVDFAVSIIIIAMLLAIFYLVIKSGLKR